MHERRDRVERSTVESLQLPVSARQIHVSSRNNGMLINYGMRMYCCSLIVRCVRDEDIIDTVPQLNLGCLLRARLIFHQHHHHHHHWAAVVSRGWRRPQHVASKFARIIYLLMCFDYIVCASLARHLVTLWV